MKNRIALGLSIASLFLSCTAGYFTWQSARLQGDTQRLLAEAARIEADRQAAGHDRVTIRPWSGPQAIVQENKDASGIWCSLQPDRYDRMASLYVEKNLGPVLGLNGRSNSKEPGCHDLAFYVLDGRPSMQVRMSNGDYEQVDMEELVRLALAARPMNEPRRLMPERLGEKIGK